MGAMFFAVLAVAAQLDRNYIREKTLEGQQADAAKGRHGGRPKVIDAVVCEVAVAVVGTSERVQIVLTWAGEESTAGIAIRGVGRMDQLSYYPRLVERLRELAEQGHCARAIASRLHAEGFRPAKGRGRIGTRPIDVM